MAKTTTIPIAKCGQDSLLHSIIAISWYLFSNYVFNISIGEAVGGENARFEKTMPRKRGEKTRLVLVGWLVCFIANHMIVDHA